MKIQICRNAKCVERGDIPIMMLREFNENDANLIIKTRDEQNGQITIGVKDTVKGDAIREWPLLEQINEDRDDPTNPGQREEIIRYVVDDQHDSSKKDDQHDSSKKDDNDWKNHPSANLHDADSQGSELIDSE